MSTVPTSGTNITFFSGIGFNEDYKDTRWHDSLAAQQSWFNYQSVVHSETQANFQRIDGRPYIRVNKSVDEMWNTNYLSFNNADYGKIFYAFVTKIEYVQKNTCNVHFKIDVLQTWMFDMVFKSSFVAREHCQLVDGSGMPLTYTLDEGLNYGSEYRVVSTQQYQPCEGVYFLVTCCKQGMHGNVNQAYYGSLNGIPQLMVYYIHPFMLDGSVPNTNLGGLSSIGDVLGAMYTQTNAVNNIVSMYITDCLPNNPSYSNGSLGFDSNNYQNVTLSTQLNNANINTIFVSDMNYGSWVWDSGSKYAGFTNQTEVKLNCYPYRVIELTDLRGNSVTLKPEYIDSNDLIINISTALGTENKIAYTAKDYLNGSIGDDGTKIKINIHNSLINNSPNDVPVMTDSLSAFLQGHRNSIQNQKNSILWNGVFNGISGGAAVAGNAMVGNEIGAAEAGLKAIQGAGNVGLQIQALQAKQQDISNIPPSISNLGGNTYFDYGNGLNGLWIIKKEITPEYQKKLSDFFNMYGYKLNEVKIPNFHTRQYWNYVKTVGCNIVGNFNNEDLEELRAVFDNGITLWHTDDIGNYFFTNSVIA